MDIQKTISNQSILRREDQNIVGSGRIQSSTSHANDIFVYVDKCNIGVFFISYLVMRSVIKYFTSDRCTDQTGVFFIDLIKG